MQYVYILLSSRDNGTYTGCTANIEKRFREHNEGKVVATAGREPLKLLHYEAFINKSDAFARERWLKSGYGRNHTRKMLSKTLESLGG